MQYSFVFGLNLHEFISKYLKQLLDANKQHKSISEIDLMEVVYSGITSYKSYNANMEYKY